jgi:HSP20 family protein
MEDLFDRFVRDMFPSRWPSRELGSDIDWIPSTELIDKKTHYLFRADVPGVKKEDIAIAVEGDLLSIRGEIIRETKEEATITTAASVHMAPLDARCGCHQRCKAARSRHH